MKMENIKINDDEIDDDYSINIKYIIFVSILKKKFSFLHNNFNAHMYIYIYVTQIKINY